jgi:hypothetical protein
MGGADVTLSMMAVLLESEPRHALVLAMLLSYALGFAGMLLAYLSYRKRQKSGKAAESEKRPQ